MCLCVLMNYVLFMRTVDKTLSVGHRALPGTDNTLGKKKKELENPLGLESDLFNFPVSLLCLLSFSRLKETTNFLNNGSPANFCCGNHTFY